MNISLKYKLLVLLVTLPLLSLTMYFVIAKGLFEKDKISYVYDSTASYSSSKATQTRGTLKILYKTSSFLMSDFNFKSLNFSSHSKGFFKKENDIDGAYFYTLDKEKTILKRWLKKSKYNLYKNFTAILEKSARQARKSDFNISFINSKNLIILSQKISGTPYILQTVHDSGLVLGNVKSTNTYNSLLVNHRGEILNQSNFIFSDESIVKIKKQLKIENIVDGTIEIKNKDNSPYLAAYSKIGISNLSLLSIVEKSKALGAIDDLIKKSILFFIAIFSLALVISVLASDKLTSSIRELDQATKKVAAGDFNIKIKQKSNDEVGRLAKSFVIMTKTVSHLLSELEKYSKNLEKKVEQRTFELNETNKYLSGMVDCLGQGFMVFDNLGKCLPTYSKAVEKLFGLDPGGMDLADLLKIDPKERESFSTWFKYLFNPDFPFDDLASTGPTHIINDGHHIDIQYFQMKDETGTAVGLIIVATDKTRELQAEKNAEKEKKYASMILKITQNKFQLKSVIREVDELIGLTAVQLKKMKSQSVDLSGLMRNMHTVKGNIAFFDIQEVVEVVHAFESQLMDLQNCTYEEALVHLDELNIHMDKLNTSYSSFINKHEDILGKEILNPNLHLIELSYDDLTDYYSKLKAKISDKSLVKDFYNEFLTEPIESYMSHFDGTVQEVAARQGKEINPIVFNTNNTKVDGDKLKTIFSSLIHAIRNAVDHGIETIVEREQKRKSPSGTITITTDISDKNILKIQVEDDGGGINPKILKDKLIEKGLDPATINAESDHQVIQHVFDSGLTTRDEVTEVSGRGVGMDAIYTAAKEMGGSAEVFSTIEQGSKLIVEVPVPEV